VAHVGGGAGGGSPVANYYGQMCGTFATCGWQIASSLRMGDAICPVLEYGIYILGSKGLEPIPYTSTGHMVYTF